MSFKSEINFTVIIMTIIECVMENGLSEGLETANGILTGNYPELQIDRAFNLLGYKRPYN